MPNFAVPAEYSRAIWAASRVPGAQGPAQAFERARSNQQRMNLQRELAGMGVEREQVRQAGESKRAAARDKTLLDVAGVYAGARRDTGRETAAARRYVADRALLGRVHATEGGIDEANIRARSDETVARIRAAMKGGDRRAAQRLLIEHFRGEKANFARLLATRSRLDEQRNLMVMMAPTSEQDPEWPAYLQMKAAMEKNMERLDKEIEATGGSDPEVGGMLQLLEEQLGEDIGIVKEKPNASILGAIGSKIGDFFMGRGGGAQDEGPAASQPATPGRGIPGLGEGFTKNPKFKG